MLHIEKFEDGIELYKALGSDIRVEIIRQLILSNGMSMNELAGKLGITAGALTAHIKKLESCGLVSISNETL